MERFFGMMPSSEVAIEKTFKDKDSCHIYVEAGSHGWSVLYSDGSVEFADADRKAEENLQYALEKLYSHFNKEELTECEECEEECCGVDCSGVGVECEDRDVHSNGVDAWLQSPHICWARDEIKRVFKDDDPNFDIDSDDLGYAGSCYKSALKAYSSIIGDGHSGMSYNFTKSILIKLLNDIPLTPITDADFEGATTFLDSDEELLKRGVKSDIQCPRRTSLFRKETVDGKVSYTDVDRSYCVNIDEPDIHYSGFGCGIVDEMFPITMPYTPDAKPFIVETKESLVNKSHGDFDTVAILSITKPDGEKVPVNRYFTDGRNAGFDTESFEEITKEQYNELEKKRLDKVEK